MPFMIDGVVVPAPSLGKLYQWNRVSISFNDIFANFWDLNIAQKDKFIWSYPYITAEDLQVIEQIIKPKINGVGFGNRFDVTSWTPDRGFVTVPCYLGTPIDYEVLASDNGVPKVLKVEYHWIQIPGALAPILGGGGSGSS